MTNKEILLSLGLVAFLINISGVKAPGVCAPLLDAPYPCSYYTDNVSCDLAGCKWSENVCSGTPYPCYHYSRDECESHGCINIIVTTIRAICSDTDGGKNYYVKGTMTDIIYPKTDYCIDENVLREYACYENSEFGYYFDYTCPNGCKDGACLTYSQITTTSMPTTTTPPEKVCTDTDGGLDYYVKGCVSAYWKGTTVGGGAGSCDRCLNSSTLSEQYCDENENGNFTHYTCPNGCKDGACLEGISTTTIYMTTTTIQKTTTTQEIIEGPKKPNIFVRIYQRIVNFFKTLLGKWYEILD